MCKKFYLGILLLAAISFMPGTTAADPPDPLARNRVIGNSSEIIAVWPIRGDNQSLRSRVWDFDGSTLYEGGDSPSGVINPDWNRKMVDIASGDFDGDDKDDIVMASVYDNTVRLNIPTVSKSGDHYFNLNPHIVVQETEVYYGYDLSYELGNIYLVSGNFDDDAKKEFVLAFWDAAYKRIEIKVYNADDLMSPELAIENDDIYMNELLRDAGTFDIAAGDFDCDGIDEIIVAYGLYAGDRDFRVAVKVFKVDMDGGVLVSKATDESLFEYDPQTPANSEGDYVERIAIATGNFDNTDCGEEAVICYQYRLADWVHVQGTQYTYKFYTKHYYYLQPIEISSNLNEIDYDISNRINHLKDWYEHATASPYPYDVSGFSMSVAAGDLNLDGRDDLVWAVNDRFVGLTADNDLSLTEEFRIVRGVLWSDASFHTTLITDLDVDPDEEKWRPEIVLQDWIADAESRIRVFEAELDYDNNFTGNLNQLDVFEGNNRHANQMAIAAGDIDGDGIRIGSPTYTQYTEFSQPTVIINPPPVHFDKIDGTVYDINDAFKEYFDTSPFQSVYKVVTSNSTEVISEATADWGIDMNLEGSANYMGVGVTANMNTTYGEKFTKINSTVKTLSVGQTRTVRANKGLICVAETDFDIWEYPVLYENETEGHILVINPATVIDKWYSTVIWNDNKYIPEHEPGNILSYPYYGDIAQEDPNVDSLIRQSYFDIGQGDSDDQWWLKMQYLNDNSIATSCQVNMEVGLTVSGYGLEVGVGAHYGREQISTYTTTFNNDLELWSYMGGVDNQYRAPYGIIPYAYWAQNGALVLDYCVEPHEFVNGISTLWMNLYGGYPDPALILPYRFHPEKDWVVTDDEREITHDIILDPSTPIPGNPISITGRVHNFSMLDCDENIEVEFFLGDPDNGGIMISPGVLSTVEGIDSRRKSTVEFEWDVPLEMPAHSRIYMVLDPDDKIEEIHEDNNKGWKYVYTPGGVVTDVTDNETALPLPTEFGITAVYPNPFNPSTNIQFALETRTHVTILIYNILGQRVTELADEIYPAGYHEIGWDGTNDSDKQVASGIYFCHIRTDSKSDSKKMLLLK